jgi:hypothetical protein
LRHAEVICDLFQQLKGFSRTPERVRSLPAACLWHLFMTPLTMQSQWLYIGFMGNDSKRTKRSNSFRLTPEALDLLAAITRQQGLTQSGVLEILMRKQATPLRLHLSSAPDSIL